MSAPDTGPEPLTMPPEAVREASENFLVKAKIRRLSSQIRAFSQLEGYLKAMGIDPQTWLSDKAEERSSLLKKDPPDLFRPAAQVLGEESGLRVPRALAGIIASSELFGAGPWLRLPFAPWTEGINESPPTGGGSIVTHGLYPGPEWGGKLSPRGDWYEGWSHTWHTVMAFPPPVLPSLLAYRFTQSIDTFLFHAHEGYISHYVGVGEVPILSDDVKSYSGSESWPLTLNFAEERGHYGRYQASSDIQGEFGVRENRVPALSIIAGTTVTLESGNLQMVWGSSFPRLTPQNGLPAPAAGFGFLEYRYISEQVMAPLLREWSPPD